MRGKKRTGRGWWGTVPHPKITPPTPGEEVAMGRKADRANARRRSRRSAKKVTVPTGDPPTPPDSPAGPTAGQEPPAPGGAEPVSSPVSTPAEADRPPASPPPAAPAVVSVTSGLPPPKTTDQWLPSPGSGTSAILPAPTGVPAKKPEKLWQEREPSLEEFKELTDAFAGLIQKGYNTLADVRNFEEWRHDDERMRPHKVIIRYALKRIKFDPGLLLVALAVIEIIEDDGTTLYRDIVAHRDAKRAAGPAPGTTERPAADVPLEAPVGGPD